MYSAKHTEVIQRGRTSFHSSTMAPFRVRTEASQADIPTDIRRQAEAHLRIFQETCDRMKSLTSELVERTKSYQVEDGVHGSRFYFDAIIEFSGHDYEFDLIYRELETWIKVTSKDQSWAPLLRALFDEQFKVIYKGTMEEITKTFGSATLDLAQKCFEVMSADELRRCCEELEALKLQTRERAPKGRMPVDKLYAMEIDDDDA